MNVFDKNLLFEMSYALMRRFAFIEVGTPSEEAYRRLLTGPGGAIVAKLLPLRHLPTSARRSISTPPSTRPVACRTV